MFRLVFAVSLIVAASASILATNSTRIVGGQATTINAHPYQVSLQYRGSHFCGGSIFSKRIIITAAHCAEAVASVPLSSLQVRLGSTQWNSGGVLRKVSKIVSHPYYNERTMQFDLALVKLSAPITYSATIKNIVLASGIPKTGAVGIISGWGTMASGASTLPRTLQSAEVKFIRRATCASNKYNYGSSIRFAMICAAADGKDSCQGDSGGPLVRKDTNRLVGVVSWGSGCALKNYPGVYTTVPLLRRWIANKAARM